MEEYDLIVLGGGAAGEKGAAQGAYFGKRVALIEKDPVLGGATAGTTVPSKTLRETALALSGIRSRKLHGVDLSLRRDATVRDFLHHERRVKQDERDRARENMHRHGVDLYFGSGTFVDSNTIQIETSSGELTQVRGASVLIATGSSPRQLPDMPDDPRIYDSDTILQMDTLPRRLVVVGGGVIGCEYSCTFAALGCEVTLIHGRDTLLEFLDREISASLLEQLPRLGIELRMSAAFEACTASPEELRITLKSGEEIAADGLLLAIGRQSNTALLNLDAAGVKTGKYGLLKVNYYGQILDPDTQEPEEGLYAAGDVVGAPALASTSMEQARYAVIHALDLPQYKDNVRPILPSGVYTIPECACAGLTERECQEAGMKYVVGKASYGKNARGKIIGDEDGFLKLIYECPQDASRPMNLLGVHIIGEMASELIHTGLIALMMQETHELFINTCFNYPTLGELYKYATYSAMGARNAAREA